MNTEVLFKDKPLSFTYSFESPKSSKAIFDLLLTTDKWWSGIYEESITGKSSQLGDEFSFSAGGGAHYSKQKLIEIIPNKKIVWQVTESNLTFLNNPKEWENSKICFTIIEEDNHTKVIFTHKGLVQKLECYKECANAWIQYLKNLKEILNCE